MISRVTSSMTAANTLSNMQSSAKKLAELQDRATTRQAIRRPSDDPAGAQDAISVRTELAQVSQFERNLKDADLWLKSIDSTLQSANNVLLRARDLALRANNSTMNQAARDSSAMEIEQLRDYMISLANTQVMGRHIFAGTHAGESAYSGNPVQWNGVEGSNVQRRISESATVQVDMPGPDAFGDNDTSVFALLDTLAAEMRSSVSLTSSIAAIDLASNKIIEATSASGARHATIDRAMEAVQLRKTELTAVKMTTEEKDLAEASVEFQTQQVYYQATLAVTSKALSVSLLDYLR